jgi:hypothetical protein
MYWGVVSEELALTYVEQRVDLRQTRLRTERISDETFVD